MLRIEDFKEITSDHIGMCKDIIDYGRCATFDCNECIFSEKNNNKKLTCGTYFGVYNTSDIPPFADAILVLTGNKKYIEKKSFLRLVIYNSDNNRRI